MSFENNVFINCPFDEDYYSLLRPLLFTIVYLGYNPKIATERADNAIRQAESLACFSITLNLLFIIFKNITFFSVFIFLLLFFVVAQSQAKMNSEAENEVELSEQKLDSFYTAVKKQYEDNPEFIASLKKAQQAWITFRDAHLESVYPGKNKQTKYASVYSSCVSNLLIQLNEQRTEQLRKWLEGTEEGDVCAGSIKLACQLE